MAPTVMRLLGALGPNTEAGTMVGTKKVVAAAADFFKNSRRLSLGRLFSMTGMGWVGE
jgi:hypothetical protein